VPAQARISPVRYAPYPDSAASLPEFISGGRRIVGEKPVYGSEQRSASARVLPFQPLRSSMEAEAVDIAHP